MQGETLYPRTISDMEQGCGGQLFREKRKREKSYEREQREL